MHRLVRRPEIQLLTVGALENHHPAGLGYALYCRHECHGLLAFGALGKIGRPGWGIWVQRENALSARGAPLRVTPHQVVSCECASMTKVPLVRGTHAVRRRFAPMKKIEDYHAHAAECRSMANRAGSPEDKAMLMNMAATWESLAIDRHRNIARQVRIDELEKRAAASIPIDPLGAANDD
jgi:hypothetical protein